MAYRSYLLPQLKEIQSGQEGMCQVIPGLYIGNLRDSKDSKQLDTNRITHILSIHDDARKLFKDKKYLLIAASDSPRQDIVQFVPQCNDFIHAARVRGGHVLIHCLAGISRSVTVAAAYLVSVTSLNHQEALQAVRAARKVANPNVGFQKQLGDFEVHGLQKERRRIADKFRPRSALVSAASGPLVSGAGSMAIAGRLPPSAGIMTPDASDNLSLSDQACCEALLDTYRHLVLAGDMCGGDCPDGGAVCPSGVCRAHNRPWSSSFLRRGAKKSCDRSPASAAHWNVWSILPEDQLRLDPAVPRRRSERDLTTLSVPSSPAAVVAARARAATCLSPWPRRQSVFQQELLPQQAPLHAPSDHAVRMKQQSSVLASRPPPPPPPPEKPSAAPRQTPGSVLRLDALSLSLATATAPSTPTLHRSATSAYMGALQQSFDKRKSQSLTRIEMSKLAQQHHHLASIARGPCPNS